MTLREKGSSSAGAVQNSVVDARSPTTNGGSPDPGFAIPAGNGHAPTRPSVVPNTARVTSAPTPDTVVPVSTGIMHLPRTRPVEMYDRQPGNPEGVYQDIMFEMNDQIQLAEERL